MDIDGTNLSMIRGDSESFTVSMATDATPPVAIPFVAGDTVTLTIKTKIDGTEIMQKVVTVFTDGKAVFEFDPEDTETLKSKSYVYDVEYRTAAGRVKTIIETSSFELRGDVTTPEVTA